MWKVEEREQAVAFCAKVVMSGIVHPEECECVELYELNMDRFGNDS